MTHAHTAGPGPCCQKLPDTAADSLPRCISYPPYLPVCLNTQGPTLTLRVKGYSLMSDVASSQSRPRVPPNAFKTAPLVVLNNFSPQQKQLALAANLFQGMFPSINVHTVNLSTCQVRGGSSSSSSGGCSFIQD